MDIITGILVSLIVIITIVIILSDKKEKVERREKEREAHRPTITPKPSPKENDNKSTSNIPAGIALCIFFFSPIIAWIISSSTQPQDGSGAAWAPVGLFNGSIFWGVASIIGCVLSFSSMGNKKSGLAVLGLCLNALVAVPFVFGVMLFFI